MKTENEFIDCLEKKLEEENVDFHCVEEAIRLKKFKKLLSMILSEKENLKEINSILNGIEAFSLIPVIIEELSSSILESKEIDIEKNKVPININKINKVKNSIIKIKEFSEDEIKRQKKESEDYTSSIKSNFGKISDLFMREEKVIKDENDICEVGVVFVNLKDDKSFSALKLEGDSIFLKDKVKVGTTPFKHLLKTLENNNLKVPSFKIDLNKTSSQDRINAFPFIDLFNGKMLHGEEFANSIMILFSLCLRYKVASKNNTERLLMFYSVDSETKEFILNSSENLRFKEVSDDDIMKEVKSYSGKSTDCLRSFLASNYLEKLTIEDLRKKHFI